jgi:hypothetical protein
MVVVCPQFDVTVSAAGVIRCINDGIITVNWKLLERSDQAEFEGEAVDLEGVRKGTLLQNGL